MSWKRFIRFNICVSCKFITCICLLCSAIILWYISHHKKVIEVVIKTDSYLSTDVNHIAANVEKNDEIITPDLGGPLIPPHFIFKNKLNLNNYEPFKHTFTTYKEALNFVADENDPTKTVIISTADAGYLDMTLNFFIGSIKRHGLTNFLMLCIQQESCDTFRKYGIPVYFYSTEKAGGSSSRYNSPEFRRKTHIKTRIVLDALKLGFTVVLSDVDIVYLKNPLNYWPCPTCDLQVSSDYVEANSGFYLVKPNSAGKRLHEEMLKRVKPNNSNQKTLNPAMSFLKKTNQLKYETLTNRKWPCGIVYWENEHRMWHTDKFKPEHVMVHNNWIETSEAKIYRFKESQMWYLDRDNYYSNQHAKYITYSNPIDFGKGKTRAIEGDALADAIGIAMALKRILILPAFHCDECKYGACKSLSKTCALNVRFHLQEFDKEFKKIYREHIFLDHPFVPKNIKSSQSKELVIETDLILKNSANIAHEHNLRFTPQDTKKGATSEEIIEWFNSNEFKDVAVLNFSAMYDAFKGFTDPQENAIYREKIKRGLVKGGYRQYRWET